jgi:hypothetical protein
MKLCQVCCEDFEPKFSSMQIVCGLTCARRLPIVQRKADKEKLKRRADWLKDVEKAFNAYIVRRDAKLPCVSCGCTDASGWHASHYRSVGSSPALRFDDANVHRSCTRCNLHLHGNPIPYRAELLRRIGQAEVSRLEGPQSVVKHTVDDLKALKATYQAKLRELR